ncbi:hypothetical protein JXE69_000360 [Salmonella enterica subsp. houtenae serovar 17:z29:-]|nr:hypothetical protein [Salmonella enterica subsp. houtenae serovar 17:z29:-]
MKFKKYLFLVFLCNVANAKDIKLFDCSYERLIQQDKVYWCLVDKYQQSALALKHEEASAEKRLKEYDHEGDPDIHLARITFSELHRSFVLYRAKQCEYSSLSSGTLPGYRIPIVSLYCRINMNISQTKWIKGFI